MIDKKSADSQRQRFISGTEPEVTPVQKKKTNKFSSTSAATFLLYCTDTAYTLETRVFYAYFWKLVHLELAFTGTYLFLQKRE